MIASGGKVERTGTGDSLASAAFDAVQKRVTVSLTNRGDAPVVVEMRDGGGARVARFTFPPAAGKVARDGSGVRFVDFRCQQGVQCRFEYELSAS